MAYLQQKPDAPAREVAEQVGISHRKVEQNIAKLRKKYFLRRVGPDKGGYWKVLK
jgi:ATP-dependent DNA helicase RecG